MLNHQVQNVSATLSDGTSRPIGRNFIQIIIWISLCSVTALRDLAVAISFRLSSEFHCAQWPHFGYAQWPQVLVSSSVPPVSSSVSHVSSSVVENTCLLPRRNDIRLRISSGTPPATLDVTSTETYGRNFIQIIIWISLCSVTALRDLAVAISFRLSSEFHCAQWPQVLVSSSVPPVSSSTSKFDLLKSNEEATAGFENTFSNAKTHRQIIAVCISSGTPPATLDVTSLERNAARYSRCDMQSLSVRALRNLIC
jgi:hypothetical protein